MLTIQLSHIRRLVSIKKTLVQELIKKNCMKEYEKIRKHANIHGTLKHSFKKKKKLMFRHNGITYNVSVCE